MNRYPYRRRDDLVRMQALLLATRPKQTLSDFPTPRDLAQLLEHPDMGSNTALWWSDDKLVTYALIADGNVYTDAFPEIELELDAEIQAWRDALSKPGKELEVAP